MSPNWRGATERVWAGLSPRERRVGALALAMVVGLLCKLVALDPVEARLDLARASLAAKQTELAEAMAQKSKLRKAARESGQEGALEEIARWRARSAELDAKIGAANGLTVSGAEAVRLMEALALAAGPGLRELSLPSKGQKPSQPEGMGYEHRIHLTMEGGWEERRRALKAASSASPALRLRRLALYRGAKGESLMRAEFAALSLDPSWRLPAAAAD